MEMGKFTWMINAGSSYLLEEERGENIYKIFKDILRAGYSGLCITRVNPLLLKGKMGVRDVKYIWLSDTPIKGYLSTKDLIRLSVEANRFLREVRRGIILLDGFEYLCSQYSFETALRFLQVLRERVSLGSHILLLSLSPEALDRRQLMRVRRELQPLKT